MPRALWSGAISFGLVNVPVKLYRATSAAPGRGISFHQLHGVCGTRKDAMSGPFEHARYRDTYTEAVKQVIERKIEGEEVVEAPAELPSTRGVVDLMEVLRRSVDQAGSGGGAKASPATSRAAKEPAAKPARAPAHETKKSAAARGRPASRRTASTCAHRSRKAG